MIAGRVRTQQEVEDALRQAGYEPTEYRTVTGVIWKSNKTGKYIQVPDPYMEMYPDTILKDLKEVADAHGTPILH